MITSLRAGEIDIGIGLTEAWVAGLSKSEPLSPYKLVGTYVETPLCWAISTGASRNVNAAGLKGGKMGVSRVGSGSYVMGYVLADQEGWLGSTAQAPFEVVPLQTFAKLRDGVNDGTADFFMWEHFTSKKYYDSGEIKRIGEIYTPWPSWMIVAREPEDERLQGMFRAINEGVKYFEGNKEEAVGYISTELDYSREDAEEWLKTVRFAGDVQGVKLQVIEDTIKVLRKAGVVGESCPEGRDMIGNLKEEA
jgi:ABC-type nitrate/sulfonate/bicarbonate transport system substrate-binding protein